MGKPSKGTPKDRRLRENRRLFGIPSRRTRQDRRLRRNKRT